MSRFYNLEAVTFVDNIGLSQLYKEDASPNKIDLGIEVNNNEYGLEIVFPEVQIAEKAVVADQSAMKKSPSLLGTESFIESATSLVLGEDAIPLEEERAFGAQVLGGSGGLRVAAEFLLTDYGYEYVYISDPSPYCHALSFTQAGLKCREYRYWSRQRKCLDLKGMLQDLQNAPANSVVLFQACSHNPTGCDPTQEQWEAIFEIVEANAIFPIFYTVFRGLASGDIEQDVWPVRYAVSKGLCLIVVDTFSKVMGLSSERVANMVIVTNDAYACELAKVKIAVHIRAMYSNPPPYGALIADYILRDKKLFQTWKANVEVIHSHMVHMRKLLRERLEELGTPGDWSHLTAQKGVFSLSGLNDRQSFYLMRKYHIYIPMTGRISMCAVTKDNVKYIAEAIHHTVTLVG